jgi:hypothetical protein
MCSQATALDIVALPVCSQALERATSTLRKWSSVGEDIAAMMRRYSQPPASGSMAPGCRMLPSGD